MKSFVSFEKLVFFYCFIYTDKAMKNEGAKAKWVKKEMFH